MIVIAAATIPVTRSPAFSRRIKNQCARSRVLARYLRHNLYILAGGETVLRPSARRIDDAAVISGHPLPLATLLPPIQAP